MEVYEGGIVIQHLTFIKPGRLEWWDVPEPHLEKAGEALVRPVAVATCDLDAEIIAGRTPFAGPFAFGHEFVAEVLEEGLDVHHVCPGQLAVVPFQISCGECARCRRGLTANCTAVPNLSMYGFGGNWGGALSDVVRVPFADQMLVAVPEGVVPGTIASASDNIPDAGRTVGPYLATIPGARILIGVAVSAVVHSRTGDRGWRIVLWISTVVMVILTFLSLLIIGVFLLPSTLIALFASALSLGARR